MFAKSIGAVFNLEIEPQDGKLYSFYDLDNGFSLSKDQDRLGTEFLQEYFVQKVGRFEIDDLVNNMYIYNISNLDELPKELQPDNHFAVFQNINAMLHAWLFSLWFVKDNSVNIRTMYLYLIDSDKSSVDMISQNKVNSTARGKQECVKFTMGELSESLNWLDILSLYLKGKEKNGKKEKNRKTEFRKDDSEHIYATDNRFLRAMRFIMEARGETFLPSKITSYISALESMLSTSTTELKFQVSERAAKLIGGSLEEQMANFDIVREAYDARSAYVHGSVVNRKYRNGNKLEELAVKLDDLMRNLMKVMLQKHTELATMKQEELSVWYKKLMFKK
ncbi:TPA: hypothetical protein ROY31_005100 [Bacillus thuringiensis]|nr:hypothetical protein [Bacillus thuringiensis]HDX9619984.1 hypothetical protein [Bacillus thuringiensis]